MSRKKTLPILSKLRLVLLGLILVMISIILYTGGRLITQSDAKSCEHHDIASHQFSMVSLLSQNCSNSTTPRGVCKEGEACNTP